jgi:predicted Zn finger-like uncharacterized protein
MGRGLTMAQEELKLTQPVIVTGIKFYSSAIGTKCPNCKTEMLIQDNDFQESHYNVKCMKCGYLFQVEIAELVYRLFNLEDKKNG